MYQLFTFLLIFAVINDFVIGADAAFKLDEDNYEYDERTNTRRLKYVKEVVEDHDHLSKDFPKILDCGPDETQNWYEPDPDDCSCYFVCTGRYYLHRSCTDGLMFDPNSEQCNWPDMVKCGDRPVPWNLPQYHGPAQHVNFNSVQEYEYE